jgi:hypothetical protein
MKQALIIPTAIVFGIFILSLMITSAVLEMISNLLELLAHKLAAIYERFEKTVYGYK